jgi:hypothetical protein
MSQFEDAVKQVARISRQDHQPKQVEPPPTDLLPIQVPGESVSMPKPREPDTVPLSVEPPPGLPPQGDGRETRFFQIGPGWGEPQADARPAQPDLSMEDEEMPEPETLPGVMPPTTDVERVERRKEEVLPPAQDFPGSGGNHHPDAPREGLVPPKNPIPGACERLARFKVCRFGTV